MGTFCIGFVGLDSYKPVVYGFIFLYGFRIKYIWKLNKTSVLVPISSFSSNNYPVTKKKRNQYNQKSINGIFFVLCPRSNVYIVEILFIQHLTGHPPKVYLKLELISFESQKKNKQHVKYFLLTFYCWLNLDIL